MRQNTLLPRFVFLVCLASSSVVAATSWTARYAPGSAQGLAVDASGNIFVSASGAAATAQSCLLKLDPQGNLLGQTCIDNFAGALVAVGPDGNPILAGTTSSAGSVKLVSPLSSQTAPQQGYVVKFKADLSGMVFATLFGGTANTVLSALTVNQQGDIYLGGWTDGVNFPTTSGAFQSTAPTRAFPAWVAAISSAGDRLLWSTLLGGPQPSCTNCNAGMASVSSMAVDSTGAVIVAGVATNEQIPVTAGVIGPSCRCAANTPDTFLAKLAAGGSQLVWATYLNHATVSSLALDQGGNIVIGASGDSGFATTPGVVQAAYPASAAVQADANNNYAPTAGFVARLNPSATQFLFATWLGGNNFLRTIIGYNLFVGVNGVRGVAVDADGTIWATGGSLPSELPMPNSNPILGADYVIGLSPDGSSVKTASTIPEGGAGLAIAISLQGPVALGKAGSILVPGSNAVGVVGIVNSAGLNASGTVSPNELVSFYGYGLGPSAALAATAVNGALPTSLGGVRVEFDGVAAPLLYAGPHQINAVVPSSVDGKSSTTVRIVTPNGELTGLVLSVAAAIPEVFAAPGPGNAAYALNQDGTVNSMANPAAVESVVSVWATGGGLTGNPEADGAITGAAFYPLALPLTMGTGFPGAVSIVPVVPLPAVPDVLYFGDAPSLVKGTTQINFRIPEFTAPHPDPVAYQFYIQVGKVYSDPFTVYVR